MPEAVLIIEDEESAARLIAALCGELGLPSRSSRSGREALAMLEPAPDGRRPFACVVLDLVLAELDGFQVARTVRGTDWGKDLPLIVVSGVYKQLPLEFMALARPAAFLPKPFEPSQMREALMRVIKGAEPGAEGDFTSRSPAALLVELQMQKASGTLTLSRGTTVRKLTLQSGQVRFAQSNVKTETAGAAQVQSGLIKQAAFDRALADAKMRKVPLHEALAASRVLTPEQLKQALRQQTLEASVGGLAWTDGTFRFEPLPPDKIAAVPDLRISVVSLVSEAARRFGDIDTARTWLSLRAPEKLSRNAELERELFSLRAAWPGEGVTALAQPGRKLAEIVPRVREAELPLLQALCESGLLSVGEARAAGRGQDEDKGKVFSAQESDVRRLLFLDRDRLKSADHYALLGVAAIASPVEVKAAYIAAAKKYHSDSFSSLELGSARKVAEDLFRRVAEAHSVLLDEKKRAEYDVFLDRKAKGLPTDVAAILKAEGLFLRGEAQARNSRWEEAEASFRDAIALNYTEAEFHGYLGIAMFRNRGKAAEALMHVEKALSMDARLPSALYFAGLLHEALGEAGKAKKFLEQTLEANPKHAEAERELARLRKKPGDAGSGKGGVFSRFFKGKSK